MRARPRRTASRGALRSLQVRNYRLYCIGQLASLFGTWMQTVALAWLVLELTDSGTQVGLVTGAQFVPVLALAGPAGVLIDRFDRRRSVIGAEAALLVQATVLAFVVVSGVVEVWMLYVLSFLQGVGNAVEQPGRQALLSELVEDKDLPNAVSLNAALFTMARVAGPAAAAVLISVSGVGVCFTINALSFVGIIVALAAMRPAEMHHRPRIERARGQLREGIAYVARSPSVRPLFLSSAVLGLLSQNVNVVLPVLAKETFGGGAGAFGTMAAVTAAGACFAAFWMAGASPPSDRRIMMLAALLGATLLLTAVSPTLLIALVVLPAMGYAHLGTMVTTNAANQLRSPPVMRGRTIALYFSVSSGSAAVGAFLIGALSDAFGPRAALGIGGLLSLAVASTWNARLRRAPDPVTTRGPAGTSPPPNHR
jgi:MFS family permease